MHILSFDIEDWFHTFNRKYYNNPGLWKSLPSTVEKNTEIILDFLKKHNIKATFFCLGWITETHQSIIKKISRQGHHIAAHSYLHNKREDLSKKSFYSDTERNIKTLEDITGEKVNTFRAPGFSLNHNAKNTIETLYKLGIRYDSSLKSGFYLNDKKIPDNPFLIKTNNISIKEFPIHTFSFLNKKIIYSGSGYFRVLPYNFIKNKIMAKEYEMLYFHPRDFDNSVHKYINNPLLKLKYRFGTYSTLNKLKFFSKDFNFLSIEEADKSINWEKAEKIFL